MNFVIEEIIKELLKLVIEITYDIKIPLIYTIAILFCCIIITYFITKYLVNNKNNRIKSEKQLKFYENKNTNAEFALSNILGEYLELLQNVRIVNNNCYDTLKNNEDSIKQIKLARKKLIDYFCFVYVSKLNDYLHFLPMINKLLTKNICNYQLDENLNIIRSIIVVFNDKKIIELTDECYYPLKKSTFSYLYLFINKNANYKMKKHLKKKIDQIVKFHNDTEKLKEII